MYTIAVYPITYCAQMPISPILKVSACALIILICLMIIYRVSKGVVTNEQNIHLMRYYAKKGYGLFGIIYNNIISGGGQAAMDNGRGKVTSCARLSSKRIPPKFATYAKMIESCIADEIKRYQNGQFMPIMHDSVKGGKRIRGAILLSIVDNSAREYLTAAVRLAACIELMHCSSLVFDDIMDGDIYRRGLPSIYYKYGIGKAQMAGMLLLTSANNVMSGAFALNNDSASIVAAVMDTASANTASEDVAGADTNPANINNADANKKLLPAEYRVKFSERILSAGKTLVNGQMRDLNTDHDGENENLDTLIDEKTSILFKLVFELAYDIVRASKDGAEEGDATANAIARDKITMAGGLVGTAFQISDDFDDIAQDSESPGGMQKNYVLRYGATAAQKRLDEIRSECTSAFTEGGIMNSDIEKLLGMICTSLAR